MAKRQDMAAAVLLVVVLALSGLGAAQVVPIANCWRTSTTGDAVVTRLFFGYNNPTAETVNVSVGLTNTYTNPPDVNEEPQSTFYAGMHGLSQIALLTPDISLNRTWALTWILGTLGATIDDGKAVQECNPADLIQFELSIPDATTSNETAIADVLADSLSIEASRFEFAATNTMTTISVKIHPPIEGSTMTTSQFEAMLTLNDNFFNPNMGLRAQLGAAVGGNVASMVGGSTSTDVQGSPYSPPDPPPVTINPSDPDTPSSAPSLIAIAHCWEPDRNDTDDHAHLYFGYVSTYTDVITIDPDTPGQNQFLGVPSSFSSPVPVFYPGVNGFVARVHVRNGALVQWILNGTTVLLNTQDADFACDEATNQLGLVSVAAFASGTFTQDQAQNGIDALSDVTHLPISNVQGDYTNVISGGFRAEYNLTSPSVQFESVYTAMWRSINDFHLANSSLNTQWNEIFSQPAANYSSAGTAGDLLGSDLPPSSTFHVPIAHCWVPGNGIVPSKTAYFGYVSNYPNTLSYLQGPNNAIVNSQGFTTPDVLFSGFNGFTSVVLVSGTALDDKNLAWNLAGSTAVLDLTNSSQQCSPNLLLQFTISFTGTFLSDIDEVQAAQSISEYVSQNAVGANVNTFFDPTVDGFIATVTVTPTRDYQQYNGVYSFIQRCNSFNSYNVKSRLSSFANATAGICQASGTDRDVWGSTGTTPEVQQYGNSSVTLNAICWTQSEDMTLTAYFGYTSSSVFSLDAPSTFTGGNVNAQASFAPAVFNTDKAPFAAKAVATGTNHITWSVLGQSITISTDNAGILRCSGDLGASVVLAFERTLQDPPPQEPIRDFIAQLTGYPFDHIVISWEYDTASDFKATVDFVPLDVPVASKKDNAPAPLPIDAVITLVKALTTDPTQSAALSTAATAHLYYVKPTSYAPGPIVPPTDVAPVTSPSPSPKKGLGGAVTFAIVVGVLLGVGIIGGILFYFFKRHKGMCRDEVEHRPLLAE